jgi:UPF0755 protein
MKAALKFTLGFLVYSFTTLVVIIAVALWWAAGEFKKPGPLPQTALIEIPAGTSLNGIAGILKQNNAVDNPFIFVLGARVMNQQGDLKAGEYELNAHMSQREILTLMTEGKVFARRVTIPEGLTSYEIVELLKKAEEIEGDITAVPPEGALLPDTYDYRRNETRPEIITRMQDSMVKAIEELWLGRAQNLPFTTQQEALTLASIVEKETGVASERKRIAGVFINRLRQNIALQTDPTVIYAITKGKHENEGMGPLGRRLLSKDLEFDSPYNTYLYPGLPPGPIANPGRAAIEAVLQPEEHNFLYFVADGTGGHVFAATLEEHNQNVEKWRKIRREQAKNN